MESTVVSTTDLKLPTSIYTRLGDEDIPYLRYRIDEPEFGLVLIDFLPEATDEQIDVAAAICQEFGKTLIQPELKRSVAIASVARLTQIIEGMESMTTAQRWAAVVDVAKVQRAMIRYLMRLE